MTQQYDFEGVEDLTLDNEGAMRHVVTGIAWLLAGLILAFSAITTFSFFSEYAPGVANFVPDAELAPVVAGLVGVVLLDLGAFAWMLLRAFYSSTSEQMSISLAAGVTDFVLSLATSALYVVLSSSFELGIRDANGQLTQLGTYTHYAGVFVVSAALICNFTALFLFMAKSHSTKAAAQRTGLRAIVASGRHKADRARAEMVIRRTLADILAQLPGAAEQLAASNSQGYFASTMRQREERPALDAHQLNALLAQLGYTDAISQQPAPGDDEREAQRLGFSLVELARAQATQRGAARPLRPRSRQQ